jgi:hypothetical protein
LLLYSGNGLGKHSTGIVRPIEALKQIPEVGMFSLVFPRECLINELAVID